MAEAGPRVLHLLACDDWGGTEVQVAAQILRWGDAPGMQAAAFLQPPGPISHRLRSGGCRALSVAGPWGAAGAVARVARFLRRGRFDVIEAYGLKAGLIARAAALLGGRPAVVIGIRSRHFSQGDPGELRTRAIMTVERILVSTVAAYDANSHGARDFLVDAGFPSARFTVIPNGMELPSVRASPTRTTRPTIVCVARLVPLKRHDVLLQGLAGLTREGLDLRCEIIGYGPEEERLRHQASDLGLRDRVAFLGRLGQAEILDHLAAADLFVLTSSYEGMPGSVLEAMACGLPVVATDVDGTREVVEDGVTGALIPAADIDALIHALWRLLADPALRSSMGTAGRERVADRFSFERVITAKLRLYQDVLSSRAP
jgi:glycosyltransferase involved in cell wall biosynthesis